MNILCEEMQVNYMGMPFKWGGGGSTTDVVSGVGLLGER